MDCPKCSATLTPIDHPELKARKCDGCGGLLFKDGSLDVARSMKNADDIDQAPSTDMNSVRDIACPECTQTMTHMIDRTQHHIEFEACGHCDIAFLDAGELKDLTEFTIAERLKQSLATLKTNLGRG